MMLSAYSTPAIVIGRRNVGEGDKILTVFTKYGGKQRVIAKGIRKIASRRAPHVELFSESILTFHKGKMWDIVTDASGHKPHGSACTNLTHVAMLYFIAEVVDRMMLEHDPQEAVFLLLSQAYETIPTLEAHQRKDYLTAFCDSMLGLLGFREKTHKSASFLDAVAAIEFVIEKKLRTIKLLERATIFS